jgi:hypothetical protein
MPGQLRTSQDWIDPGGASLSAATFVPPPHYEVSQQLAEREKFLYADTEMPLLVCPGINVPRDLLRPGRIPKAPRVDGEVR